jgi:hypothetical protein
MLVAGGEAMRGILLSIAVVTVVATPGGAEAKGPMPADAVFAVETPAQHLVCGEPIWLEARVDVGAACARAFSDPDMIRECTSGMAHDLDERGVDVDFAAAQGASAFRVHVRPCGDGVLCGELGATKELVGHYVLVMTQVFPDPRLATSRLAREGLWLEPGDAQAGPGACAIGTGPRGAPAGWLSLGLAGMALVALRRRARRR